MSAEYIAPDCLLRQPRPTTIVVWVLFAALNLAAGIAVSSSPERQSDLDTVRQWGEAWLLKGTDVYAPGLDLTDPDYPPHAVVVLSPLALGPREWIVPSWAAANLGLAVLAAWLAVQVARPGCQWSTALLPILMFLTWGGFRTLLQFSLMTLVAGLLSMKVAARRPVMGGIWLGVALMKPQMAAPFLLWAIVARRWRVVFVGLAVVAGGFVVYCARAGADPGAVVQRYVQILGMYYVVDEEMMMVGLSQLRPLVAAWIADTQMASIVAGGLAVVSLAVIGALAFMELRVEDEDAARLRGSERSRLLVSAPPLACVWSLLTFYHLTYGFVLLLPVATLLLFTVDPATRTFRRTVFWALQLALMVDLPGAWSRTAPFLGATAAWTWPGHADRVLTIALFACVLALGARTELPRTA